MKPTTESIVKMERMSRDTGVYEMLVTYFDEKRGREMGTVRPVRIDNLADESIPLEKFHASINWFGTRVDVSEHFQRGDELRGVHYCDEIDELGCPIGLPCFVKII